MIRSMDQFEIVNAVLSICLDAGVRDAVVSPGSRNAPLMISLKRNFPEFRVHSVVDERSAAYKAIGISDVSGRPVVLICTSGTAAANYLPAVCEAFHRAVPLIVITADRPARLVTARDGQTIFQEHLFGRHVDAYFGLDPETNTENILQLLDALSSTLSEASRPVHINLHLDEPLYQWRVKYPWPADKRMPKRNSGHTFETDELNGSHRPMVVIGQSKPGKLPADLLRKLMEKGFLVVSGGLSNLAPEYCVGHFNQLAVHELPQPDLVITAGGEITHKPLKQYLKRIDEFKHLHVEKTPYPPDTFGKGVRLIHAEAEDYLLWLTTQPAEVGIEFAQLWLQYDQSAEEVLFRTQEREIANYYLPLAMAACQQQVLLALGNSAVVRKFLNVPKRFHRNLYGNRGTAGIDGTLSAAVGMALATELPVWCLIGDLSFFYDVNALWQVPYPENLTIFVFNDHRGSIFEMIEGPRDFPEIFELQSTPHPFNCEHIARHFGLKYARIEEKIDAHTISKHQGGLVEIML